MLLRPLLAVSLSHTVALAAAVSASSSFPTQTSSYQNLTSAPLTTPRPTSSPSNGTCEADCYLQIPFNKDWYWSKLFISTTLTAATEIVVINKKTNTTTTKTIFADLPDGFTLPPTNSAGSQAVFTTFGSLTTTLVYPTPYLSWDSGYSWSGTLPTVDKAGQSVCSTVVGQQQITTTRTDSTLVPVGTETWTTGGSTTTHTDRSWSPYATTTFATTTGVFAVVPYGDTFQLPVPPADPDDPNGFLYTLTYEATKLWPKSIETDGAYLSCSTASYPAPAVPMSTALFLTETSTSIEDDDDGPTTDEPPKTSSPPDETDSPVPPPPATTEPAPAETSPAPPAPTAGPPASNTAVPQVTANPGTGETVGTVIPPPAPTNEATSNPPDSNGNQPSTFQTVNVPTTIDGSATSAPAVVIGTQTQAIAPTLVGTQVDGTATSIPAVIIGSQTVAAGQTATFDSVPVVISAPSASDSPIQVVPAAPPAPATAATEAGAAAATLPNGATVLINTASAVVVGGQTLQPGANTVAAGPGGSSVAVILTTDAAGSSVVVADGSTAPLPQAPPTTGVVVLPGGATASVNSASQVVVGGQTLQPGANTVAVGPGGSSVAVVLTTDAAGSSVIVADGSTAPLPQAPATAVGAVTLPGGATASVGAGGQVVVGGQTLSAGSNTLGSGSTVVLTTDGAGRSVVVEGGSTVALASAAAAAAAAAATATKAVATLADGEVVSVGAGGGSYVVDGQTLTAGANTLSGSAAGEVVVLTTDGEGRTVVVEDGTRTVALTGSGTAGATTGLGGVILSGLGGSASTSASRTRSGSATGETETSSSATGGASSATASASAAAAAERSASGWMVIVEGVVLAMCMVFGLLPL